MSEEVEVAVIGAGPAGLAAAEVAAAAGKRVVIFEAKPSPARKFLMAGKSGLNLTKHEDLAKVIDNIGCERLEPILRAFGPDEVWRWAEGLAEPLFTGSSGRVFPEAMKGSPLLRKWLRRLDGSGCELRTQWRWTGWREDALCFETPEGTRSVAARATILALGGASWSRLGSDAAWVPWLEAQGIPVEPFRPANMGFDVPWSDHFRERFAGEPVKPAALSVSGKRAQGEFVISSNGLEGSLVYAVSAWLRDALAAGIADLRLDLLPGQSESTIAGKLSKPRGKLSQANYLRKTIGLSGVRVGLLRELGGPLPSEPQDLARAIKSLHVPVAQPRPIDEAISVAGGVAWAGIDADLMLVKHPGIFVSGEMLDWEAPTGGYLLTACLATGRWAGAAAARLLL
ncbi:MAG: TIGR03862 family flavoprotein [Pseudomonadota bacterium]